MCVLLVNTAFHNFKLVTEVKVYFEKEKNIFGVFVSMLEYIRNCMFKRWILWVKIIIIFS